MIKLEHKQPLPQAVIDFVIEKCGNVQEGIKELSVHGKGQKLKSSKPKNPFYAFVWRQARFNSGQDLRMPTTDIFDLMTAFEQGTGYTISPLVSDEYRTCIYGPIDELTDNILREMKIESKVAVRTWGRGLGAI